jgi:hypothetical protein
MEGIDQVGCRSQGRSQFGDLRRGKVILFGSVPTCQRMLPPSIAVVFIRFLPISSRCNDFEY